MAWVSVLFLFLEQMLSLTFCQKLTSKSDLCKPPLVGLGQKRRSELAREKLTGAAFIQEARVIVDIFREQARSYRGQELPVKTRTSAHGN
ncbi:hypothetical protein PSH76_10075 [Pseudomonas sp. FP215]|uniref:hypothetical protein n=1 Tax=Pseudomonas TaxID=286 RepID=UPI0027352A31|nr:hypothetical protein [Pseudomonas sp. FP215]WLH26146.1 hypothetical protein PSH76_10075 [Pseudomonas sp. FP215]